MLLPPLPCLDPTTAAAAADIKPGQSMYYSPVIKAFYAANCAANNYGKPLAALLASICIAKLV
jgi:hypothetical protein